MIDLVLLVLVTAPIIFGVTFTIVFLDGPGNVIRKARGWFMYSKQPVYDEDGRQVNIVEARRRFFFSVLDCFWCSSFWVMLIVVGVYLMFFPIGTIILVALSSYGLSGYMYEKIANG